jgi:hypothetical protein
MVKIMLEISENQFYPFHPCSQLASHSEATKMSTLFNLRPYTITSQAEPTHNADL